ncbi:MAG TPA: hypothetical protein VMZ49_12930 [Patescibacteria group bacterium]|nr:hypothetical protein [Patescibacteria group bacterium]
MDNIDLPAHAKNRFAAAGALLFLIGSFACGMMQAAAAAATLTVRLPRAPLPARLISVVAVAAETGHVLAGLTVTGADSQVILAVKAVPQVVFADWLLSDGKRVSGRSPLLRPAAGQSLTVDLSPLGAAALFPATSGAAFRQAAFFAAAAETEGGATAIGIPANGFTVKGLDLSGTDIARIVTTGMIDGASCYGEDGGFVVVETDPKTLAILKAEIDLSNSPGADPATAMTDRYVAPGRSVSGSVESDGTSVTLTLRVVDAQGRELLSNSASGPLDQVLDINAGVAGALAAALSCPDSVGDLVLDFESVIVEKGPLAQQNVFHARVGGILLRTGGDEWGWAAQAPLDASGSRIEMLNTDCAVSGEQPGATKPFRVARGGFVWSTNGAGGRRRVSDLWIVVDPGAIDTADSGNIPIVCRGPGGGVETVTGFTPFADLFDMMHDGDGTIRGWTILNGEVYARRTFKKTGRALGTVTETTTFTLRRRQPRRDRASRQFLRQCPPLPPVSQVPVRGRERGNDLGRPVACRLFYQPGRGPRPLQQQETDLCPHVRTQ